LVRIFAGLAGLLLLRPAAESFGPRPGGSLIRLLYAGKHSFKFCDMAWREPAPALPCFFCLGESVSHCCQIHLSSICQLTPWPGPTATSFAIPAQGDQRIITRSLCGRTDRDRGVLDIPSHSHTARGGHRLTRPLLRREHDIQEPLAHRLKAHTHLVRLIRRDLAQGVVEAVD
jgi:hypothetical protein